jgi:hypothetical protein
MNSYKKSWMTQKLLKEAFLYDPKLGLVWNPDRPREHFATEVGYKVYMTQWAGKVAGKVAVNEDDKRNRDTRIVIVSYKGDKKNFPVHRLVFMYHHGYIPEYIDHIDGNYLNNLIENLQPITHTLNTAKANMFSHNTSGYRGCRYRPRDNKWIVNLKVNKCGYYLGQYEGLEYAAAVYNKFAKLIFGDCAFQNDTPICLDDVEIDNTFTRKHLPNILKEVGFNYV